MVETIQIISSDFDTLKVERIFSVDVDGRPGLHAMVDGIECQIDAKDTLLENGLVACIPLDPRFAADWPVSTEIEIGGRSQTLPGVTDQAELVSAARAFAAMELAGTARAGLSF